MCHAIVSVAAAGAGGIATPVPLLHLPAVLLGKKVGRASAS